jgi:hypothetical protein
MEKEQNEISHTFLQGSDLGKREQEVLADVEQRTGFIPEKLLSRSSWWTSTEIGAFHYLGQYCSKRVVLKIQGIRPAISEIDMISSFAKTNRSSIIRPPYLYASLPWDEEKRYEALLLELVDGPRVVQSPTTQGELQRFFALYEDYRANCLQSPWVEKPKTSIPTRIAENFVKWRQASAQLYPDHPFRKKEDHLLIDEAVVLLSQGYQDIEPEFQHGHFSVIDLYPVGDHVVLLSNLYWSWRPPLYDAVFGYHWHIYSLANVEGITPEAVETQRAIWLENIKALRQVQGGNNKLLILALLERAAAGLNLDALSVDPQQPITAYLVTATRDQVKQLISKAKSVK